MGLPICSRLIRSGFAVSSFDLRDDLRPAVSEVGADWSTSARAAADGVDVLITILPGPDEVDAVTAEAVDGLAAGSTWIDMSSAVPATARARATAADVKAIRMLDAPVGGGPGAAQEGTLIAFVGGDPADLAAQQEVLRALANRVIHVGGAGAGYAVKLLINLLWFGQALAGAEALTLAKRAGVDPLVLRDAVSQSAAANGFMTENAEAFLAGDDLATYPLSRICEQLTCALGLGSELDLPLELSTLVSEMHNRALRHYGDADGELLGARLIAQQADESAHRGLDAP